MSGPSPILRALTATEDLRAERATLGAALQGWAELEAVRAELPDGAAEFARPVHRAVYGALLALAAARDRPEGGPDGPLLVSKARELPGGERVALADLSELLCDCPTRLNAAQYAQAVHAAHLKRAALAAVDRVARDVAAGRPAELVLSRAEAALGALRNTKVWRAAPPPEPFQPFPVDALPDRMRVFVESVAAATGTDAAFAALAALVVVAGCIGNRVAVLVKSGWVEPAVLWGVLVGRSGTTKSPVLKLVTRALIDLYKAQRRAFAEAVKEYLREVERHNVRLAEWKKSQRDGPPTDPPDEPERPIERRLLVSDITVERLGELLERNQLGLLLVRDELAAWVGMLDRYASTRGADLPTWLSFYDAAPAAIDRKTSGSYFVERAAVSVLGSIQPGTLERCFGRAEREAGLLARVLVAYPPDRPALWTEAALPDDVAAEWRTLLEALLALPPAVDEHGNPRPRFIPIGAEAKALWVEWHDRHARELVDISNDDLAAHYAKLKGACARIALLFACVEVAAGGDAVACIGADAMRRAIAVVEWFKGEGRRVYAVLGETEEDRARRQLVEWIERRGGAVSVRELTHGLQQYRGRPDVAQADLDALAKAGCGAWEHPAPGPKGGRPSPRFVLATRDTSTETPAEASATGGFGVGVTLSGSARAEGDDGNGHAGDGEEWGEV